MAIKVYTCLKTPQMAWKKPSLLLQQVSGHWALWTQAYGRGDYILPTDYCILTYHHQFFSWYHIHRVAAVRSHCSDLHDMLPPTATSPLMFSATEDLPDFFTRLHKIVTCWLTGLHRVEVLCLYMYLDTHLVLWERKKGRKGVII